jgi:hypothetical protein
LKGVDENAILIFSGVGIIIYELKVKRRSDLGKNYKLFLVSGLWFLVC